jgi:branched-subunit amino acid ABC-type transport system permease component
MYALSTIALSLVWGSLNMLNMAQGALLTIGGYISFAVITYLGFPLFIGLVTAAGTGALIGLVMYFGIIQFMFEKDDFETNVIIATIGLAMMMESIVLKAFGAYPFQQPFAVGGGVRLSDVHIPYQNLVIIGVSVVMMAATAWMLGHTRLGRAIRATAQSRDAALLNGVPVRRIFAQVLALSGLLAAVSGVMLSSITTLAPTMGYDPLLKAFIICVIAGLGNVAGALYAAFFLGVFEASVQYFLGVRFGFPTLLLLVIVALIWRPYGVFSRKKVARL